MIERPTVGEVVKKLLEDAGVNYQTAAGWIDVAKSTFSQKVSRNTFYAEEVLTILDNIGMEIKIVEGTRLVNKQFGGIGGTVHMMVNRTIYDTDKSIALAHSDWFDCWRTELFQDTEGRFFVAHYTNLEAAKPFISEMSKKDAMMYYAKYGNGENADLFD